MGERIRTISAEEFRRLATGRPARVPRLSIKTAMPPGAESELPLRISLPFLPPSVNKLFASVRDERGTIIRVLTKHHAEAELTQVTINRYHEAA